MGSCFWKIFFYLVVYKCLDSKESEGFKNHIHITFSYFGRSLGSKQIDNSFEKETYPFKDWNVNELWEASPFFLPKLNFNPRNMRPFLTEQQIFYHYAKHHANYVKTLNLLSEQHHDLKSLTLEKVIEKYDGTIFNNAAQIWNHNFYWKGMKSDGEGKPYGEIEKKINESYGSFENFKEEFIKIAKSHFGSGWTWVLLDKDGKLKIKDTHDAYNPVKKKDGMAILVLDIWEHAYYVDYRNDRLEYIKEWFNKIDWDFANNNLLQAR